VALVVGWAALTGAIDVARRRRLSEEEEALI
jgi:hypothetical protein